MKRFCALALALVVLTVLAGGTERPWKRDLGVKTIRPDRAGDYRATTAQFYGGAKLPTLGTQIGTTNIDWACNGNVLNQIAADNDGGVHFGWTYRTGTAGSNRRYMYNYRGPDGTYLGATPFADIGGARWGSINCTHDGIGLGYFYYTDAAGNYGPMFAYDAGVGIGVFTLVPIDTAECNALWGGVSWPRNDKNRNTSNSDTLYCMGQSADQSHPVFISSYDRGLTWNAWTDLQDGGLFVPEFPDMQIAAGREGKVAVAEQLADGSPMHYRESSDYGVTWGPTTEVVIPADPANPNGDTILPYIHTSLFYDNDNNLHILNSFTGYNGNYHDTLHAYVGIVEWTAANGVRYIVKELTDDVQTGGGNTLLYSWPNMVQKADGTYYVTFGMFNTTDIAANGYANGDIGYVVSSDGGATWSAPVNITNSSAPGAAAGSCEDDRYPDCALSGDTLHVIWLYSLDAGSGLQSQGTVTDDFYYHYGFVPTGVAGGPTTVPTYGFALNQNRPNPVTRNAEISFSLPRAGEYSLKVFNVAGQTVKEFRGQGKAGANSLSWNAKDAPAGIYFYKLTSGGNTATKKLVVLK